MTKSPDRAGSRLTAWLESYFSIRERGSSVRIELIAGVSTFLSLIYIAALNPTILAQAGADWRTAFFATAAVSGVACIAMGLWARLPFALAPGMEMNAYLVFSVVSLLGFSWPQALGVVFWSGAAFFAASASGLRSKFIIAIPDEMKAALSLSVGIFIAMVALKISGILQADAAGHPSGLGELTSWNAISLYLGLAIILAFWRFRKPGGVIVSIAVATLLLWGLGKISPTEPPPLGQPLSLVLPDFSVLWNEKAWGSILVLFLIDLYGGIAKLIGLSRGTELGKDPAGPPGTERALLVDSGATIAGSFAGTSNMTIYVESGVGISAGGRTGITAIVCGLGLLACLPLSPLVQIIPIVATTGALAFLALLLSRQVGDVRTLGWFNLCTLVAMQLVVVATLSIDMALLVGAAAHVGRSVFKKTVPNAYLCISVVLLATSYALQMSGS